VLSFRNSVAFILTAALTAFPAFAARTHHASGSAHPSGRASGHVATHGSGHSGAHARGSRKAGATAHKSHGQQAIEPTRVTEIQQALIREHYLSSEANGKWDSTTQAAMQKYQADQGWQTKLMPDSRALKKLGLGPDYSGAINAKNSSFAEPPSATTLPPVQSAGFAAAAGVDR